LGRELLHSADWYEALWQQRDRIKDLPTLLLWGMKDPLFTARHLARRQALFSHAQTLTFPEAGHFVQEEARDTLGPIIRQFLETHRETRISETLA
jgi:haloalkane dehalogenase